MTSTQLDTLKVALLLQHPELVERIAAEATHVQELVEQHGARRVAADPRPGAVGHARAAAILSPTAEFV